MTRARRLTAAIVAVLALFVGTMAGTAGPAAAVHQTSATYTGLTIPNVSGTFNITFYWLTNSTHTAVRPSDITVTNNTNRGLTVTFQNTTFFPGGNCAPSNETGVDSDSTDYEIPIGTGENMPGPGATYINLKSRPGWNVDVRQTTNQANERNVLNRLGTCG